LLDQIPEATFNLADLDPPAKAVPE
jgi:hypothetical protein